MKRLLYFLGISILISVGCKRAVKIPNQEFNLVEPAHLEKLKFGEKCQFRGDNKIHIYAFKNKLETVADVTVGDYSLVDEKLTFPKGTFNIKQVGEDFHLTSKGKLRYLLLTDTAYNRFKVQLEHLNLQQSKAAAKSIIM